LADTLVGGVKVVTIQIEPFVVDKTLTLTIGAVTYSCDNGVIEASGVITRGSIDYTTGVISLEGTWSDTTGYSAVYDYGDDSGTITIDAGQVEFYGRRNDFLVVKFKFTVGSEVTTALSQPDFRITWSGDDQPLPLMIYSIQVYQHSGTTLTHNQDGMDMYRSAMALLAIDTTITGYGSIINISTFDPTELVGGVASWTRDSFLSWIEMLVANDPRVNSAFREAGALDVGKIGLFPDGLSQEKYNGQTLYRVVAVAPFTPCCVVLQPWMINAGSLVLNENFWQSRNL
jgi:hypothetical protein